MNNGMGDGDFEMVTDLVDDYNLLLSSTLDNMQSVANTFWRSMGCREPHQPGQSHLGLSEGKEAEFVVKEVNHEDSWR